MYLTAQLTKSRLEFASVASSEARLLAWEVDLGVVEFAVGTQEADTLTHVEWFFRHHEQAGEALSHFTFRCSTRRQTMKARVHMYIFIYIYMPLPGTTYCMSRSSRREAACACWMRWPGHGRWHRRRWSAHRHSSRAPVPESARRTWPCHLDSQLAGARHWRPWSMMRLSACSGAQRFGRANTELQPRPRPPALTPDIGAGGHTAPIGGLGTLGAMLICTTSPWPCPCFPNHASLRVALHLTPVATAPVAVLRYTSQRDGPRYPFAVHVAHHGPAHDPEPLNSNIPHVRLAAVCPSHSSNFPFRSRLESQWLLHRLLARRARSLPSSMCAPL